MSLWLVLFHPDKAVIFLSRGEREATSLLQKAKYCYKYLPQWMKDRGPKQEQDTLTRMMFDNESSIVSLPSTQDPARGESAYMIIVDEWAFLDNPEEAWASIEPVADVGGRIIGLSTANGSGNFFHRQWQVAQNSKKWCALFYSWAANTDRDQTWYDEKVEDNIATPWIVHQEYPRSAEEAFIKSGRTVFDVDYLDSLPTMEPRVGYLWAAQENSKYAEFREKADGELRVFQAPDPTGVYAIGADVAEGLEHGDYSAAYVIDPSNMSVCAVWHGHVDPDLFANVLARLGFWYNAALVGVEVNNHGLTTCVGLQKLRYPRIYYRTTVDAKTNKPSRKVGWRTQSNTKPYVIDQLASSIRGHRDLIEQEDGSTAMGWGGGLMIHDAPTIGELKLFVREADGKTMHGSPFDDRVISLAITVEMCKFVHLPQFAASSQSSWGTLDWWDNEIDQHLQDSNPMPIGAGSTRSGGHASYR